MLCYTISRLSTRLTHNFFVKSVTKVSSITHTWNANGLEFRSHVYLGQYNVLYSPWQHQNIFAGQLCCTKTSSRKCFLLYVRDKLLTKDEMFSIVFRLWQIFVIPFLNHFIGVDLSTLANLCASLTDFFLFYFLFFIFDSILRQDYWSKVFRGRQV